MSDVITLTKSLISCASITPNNDGALEVLADFLKPIGFDCHFLSFGEGDETVLNLFARIGSVGPHLCYAGHTDVVPSGAEEQWTSPPFAPEIRNGYLYGRGASDMKGSVAAMAVAAKNFLNQNSCKGSISFLITGDEEGPAVNGTVKVLEWMQDNDHLPDVALVGEPTNPSHMGQEIKIGRRGSLTGKLTVKGKQGHVAYQHLADNPLPRLVKLLDQLASESFDTGNEFFPPTNLEIVSIDVGNKADNVIPAEGSARFNIRFNNNWSGDSLGLKIREILDGVGFAYELSLICGAESFMTKPGEWSALVQDCVYSITDKNPAITTTGGTSDARFIAPYCPVIECGAINESIHQIDENTKIEDLEMLVKIYETILKRYFAV